MAAPVEETETNPEAEKANPEPEVPEEVIPAEPTDDAQTTPAPVPSIEPTDDELTPPAPVEPTDDDPTVLPTPVAETIPTTENEDEHEDAQTLEAEPTETAEPTTTTSTTPELSEPTTTDEPLSTPPQEPTESSPEETTPAEAPLLPVEDAPTESAPTPTSEPESLIPEAVIDTPAEPIPTEVTDAVPTEAPAAPETEPELTPPLVQEDSTIAPPVEAEVPPTSTTPQSILGNIKDNILASANKLDELVTDTTSLSAPKELKALGSQSLLFHDHDTILEAYYGPTSSPQDSNVTDALLKELETKGTIDIPNIDNYFGNIFNDQETVCTVKFRSNKISNTNDVEPLISSTVPSQMNDNNNNNNQDQPETTEAIIKPATTTTPVPATTTIISETPTEIVVAHIVPPPAGSEPTPIPTATPPVEETTTTPSVLPQSNSLTTSTTRETDNHDDADTKHLSVLLTQVPVEPSASGMTDERTHRLLEKTKSIEKLIAPETEVDERTQRLLAKTKSIDQLIKPEANVDERTKRILTKTKSITEIPKEQRILMDAHRKFKEYDADNSGCLDSSELMVAIEDMWRKQHPGNVSMAISEELKCKQAAEVLQKWDTDGDEGMNLDEFVNWYINGSDEIEQFRTNLQRDQEVVKHKLAEMKKIADAKKRAEDAHRKQKHQIITQSQELQLLQDIENKSFVKDSFYDMLMKETHSNVDTDKLECRVSELNELVIDLRTRLHKAEARHYTSKTESEIRDRTITALKDTTTKYLKDRDSAAHHLKTKAEQVSGLKDSIKNLKQSLEDVLQEKTDLTTKLESEQTTCQKLTQDNEQLQEYYNASLADLKALPEYKSLQLQVEEKKQLILEEKESRIAALDAWEKSQKSWKLDQEKMNQERRNYEMDAKNLQHERDELQRTINWHQEELHRLEEKLKEVEKDNLVKAEEITQFRIKVGSIETEMKQGIEFEKLKARTVIESLTLEMKWRQKMFKAKNAALQGQLDDMSLQKLKLQKQFTQLEAALQEEREASFQNPQFPVPPPHGQPNSINRSNRRILMKQRYMELEGIDAEIARLKQDIDIKQSERRNISAGEMRAFDENFTLPPINNPGNNHSNIPFQHRDINNTTENHPFPMNNSNNNTNQNFNPPHFRGPTHARPHHPHPTNEPRKFAGNSQTPNNRKSPKHNNPNTINSTKKQKQRKRMRGYKNDTVPIQRGWH